jgi:prophage regulatory protein
VRSQRYELRQTLTSQDGAKPRVLGLMALWRIDACKAETGDRSNTSIYNAIRAGLFTRPVAIGQRAKAWPDYEVKAIVRARIAGQSDEEIRELVNRLHAKRVDQLATV